MPPPQSGRTEPLAAFAPPAAPDWGGQPQSPPPQSPPPQSPPFSSPQPQVPPTTPPPTTVSTGGSGGGRGKWIGAGALVGALLLGGVGYVALGGGDDDDGSNVIADSPTSTTVAETTTTAPIEEETTTTEAPVELTTDLVATSVVQIFPAVNGEPICQGSGTIVSADGLIVTNAHVIEIFGPCAYDDLQIAITASADSAPEVRYLGEVYAIDRALDLAVIGVATDLDGNPIRVDNLAPITIGDSDRVGLGDQIRILGYPSLGGDTITFTSGSVSGFTAEAGIADRAFIKTDATISGGNSGGLAINDDFEMVGIPTQASGGANLDIADCRVVTDTNNDGEVNELDSCIPIGGFINGIRPVNLALALIDAAQARVPVEQEPPPSVGLVSGEFFDITMTTAIDENNSAVDEVSWIPSGSTQACATFDYESMVDGTIWDAIWSVDGEFVEDLSIIGSEWIGGPDGTDWWVCAGGEMEPLPDGMYEVQLYIQDEFNVSDTVHVGGAGLVDFTVVNDTAAEVCYLQVAPSLSNGWGPDDLSIANTLVPGEEVVFTLPADTYDFRGSDCDLNLGPELFGQTIAGGERISLAGG